MPATFVHPVLRFYKYVNRNGPALTPKLGPCEIWTGCTNDRGRAVFTQDGNYFYAAKWIWLYFKGPTRNLDVCHDCHNPLCVRLSHLYLDTNGGNNTRRHLEGRSGYRGFKRFPRIVKPPRKTLRERFESQVLINDGCWLWDGSLNQDGYGHMWNGKSCECTHRISWKLYHGPIPKGMSVLHNCHVRACCNPFHLHLDTQLKNVQECVEAGRRNSPRGEKHPRAKLTAPQVLEIRHLATLGWSYRQLAAKFNVNCGTISSILSRKNWAWLQSDSGGTSEPSSQTSLHDP